MRHRADRRGVWMLARYLLLVLLLTAIVVLLAIHVGSTIYPAK